MFLKVAILRRKWSSQASFLRRDYRSIRKLDTGLLENRNTPALRFADGRNRDYAEREIVIKQSMGLKVIDVFR